MRKLIPLFLLIPVFGQNPLHYNISVPKDISKKSATLFLMHGYGGNENGYKNLKERLKDDVVIVSMRAPFKICLLYTSPSPRDRQKSRMPSSA